MKWKAEVASVFLAINITLALIYINGFQIKLSYPFDLIAVLGVISVYMLATHIITVKS